MRQLLTCAPNASQLRTLVCRSTNDTGRTASRALVLQFTRGPRGDDCTSPFLLGQLLRLRCIRTYGKVYDGRRGRGRRNICWKREFCHAYSQHAAKKGSASDKWDVLSSESSSCRIFPRYSMRKYDGAGGRSSCQSATGALISIQCNVKNARRHCRLSHTALRPDTLRARATSTMWE